MTDERPARPWLPPDSLRRHDPDQVRGSAGSRTLSAEALPCCVYVFGCVAEPTPRSATVLRAGDHAPGGASDQRVDAARVGAVPVHTAARGAPDEVVVGPPRARLEEVGHLLLGDGVQPAAAGGAAGQRG